jgi:hypothetical protein
MNTIEQLHFDLHDIYLNIYKIYYETESKGFFSKIFGKKKKITDEAKALAKKYYQNMEAVSKDLVAEINRMERRIVAITDKEFASL